MRIKLVKLNEVDSTNVYLCEHADCFNEEMVVVQADYQTSGKGQGQNGWESKAGKNLLYSLLVHPKKLPVKSQFFLSMAGALSIKAVLDEYVDDITLKWPNDIYWKDCKLSGTLIELSVHAQMIRHCVYGVGLNVNQTDFESDAPNPVSLAQIVGHELDRDKLLHQLINAFEQNYNCLEGGAFDDISNQYHAALYRREGVHLYRDREGCFQAAIVTVEPDGRLVLKDTDGRMRGYYLKEVEFLNKIGCASTK